jgi:hypothetical protein
VEYGVDAISPDTLGKARVSHADVKNLLPCRYEQSAKRLLGHQFRGIKGESKKPMHLCRRQALEVILGRLVAMASVLN